MSGDLPIDKPLALTLGNEGMKRRRPSKEEYETAVLTVYDKAASSEDWVIIGMMKGCSGLAWLDVCKIAADRLDAGDSFVEAFQVAAREWDIQAPATGPQKVEVIKP